ncbi:MAG: hypothetical protein HY815_22595 [Candidatus Riflebacteria bacterium]|nr:hypothetical protein [Candidatus Riflebacteria bacterium]
MCGRRAETTEHHLVPRSRRRKAPETFGPTARLCRDCHRKVHATFDNRELTFDLDSVEKLRARPEIAAYLRWIRKRPGTAYFKSKRKKR